MASEIWLIRHGATEWSVSGKHTGRTDVPLSPEGEAQVARVLGSREFPDFDAVFVSPLTRAVQTFEFSGLQPKSEAKFMDDLMEWDYGDFEGQTTSEIRSAKPGWNLFSDGCPGGEGVKDVEERANRVLGAAAKLEGPVAMFSHGHMIRALALSYLGLEMSLGSQFALATSSISVLGTEHGYSSMITWNG